jgi:predicted HicB family RNase H-like nuclease
MKKKSKTFQMRLQATEYRALKLLAARQGVSMSALLANHIRREAKKKGIPV